MHALVRNAVGQASSEFPFHGYISESVALQVNAIWCQIKDYVTPVRGKRLLDIGCGPMDKTAVFGKLGFDCYAVDDLADPWHLRNDNADKIVQYAARSAIHFHRQKLGDTEIPFNKNSFDVVMSLAVIEHLHESPRGLLNTMGEYARTAGLLVVTMPNAVNLRKRLSVLFGKTNYPPIDQVYLSTGMWRGHVREYTLEETKQICELTGFEVLSATTFEHLSSTKLKQPLRAVYESLGLLVPGFRSGLLVIARKPEGWVPADLDSSAFRQALSKSVPSATE